MGSDLRLLFGVDAEIVSVNPKAFTWREHMRQTGVSMEVIVTS